MTNDQSAQAPRKTTDRSSLTTNHSPLSPVPLPREHGGWVMFGVPWAVGLGIAGRVGAPGLLCGFSALFVFLARHPLARLLQPRGRRLPLAERRHLTRWAVIFSVLALLCGAPVVIFWHRWWLMALAVLAAVLLLFDLAVGVRERAQRAASYELIVVSGLCLTAPCAYYAETGRMELVVFWLWVLCGLYFWGTVFYVKMRVADAPWRVEARRTARTRLGRLGPFARLCGIYSVVAPGLVLALSVGHFPAAVALAYIPAAVKALRAVLSRQASGALPGAGSSAPRSSLLSRPMTRLGFTELAHALLFAILLIVLYRG